MTKWAKRVATLMKRRKTYYNMLDMALAHAAERGFVGSSVVVMALRREIDKMENSLIILIKPKLNKESVTVGEITDADIQKAKEYPIENLIDVKKGKCLCPFHNDRNPSATVKNNKLRCWSQCSKSFDVIEVYRKIHGVSFVEAVKQLR